MKMKHRALSILLSLAILLTFMPALTFAGSSDSTKAEAKKAIVSKQLERETGSKSKDRKDPDTQKGPAVKALNTSPEEEFDDDDEYFYGTYTGRPTMTTADWTDSDGELRYDFDIEPNSGDKITITTDEGTDEFVYLKDEDGSWYFEKPDDPDDWLSIGAIDADIEKTEAAFYVYNYVWDDEEGYYTCEADLDEDEIAEYITTHIEGNSLIAVGDEDMIKVHFHTNEPWKLLEYCNSVGEIYDIVVEDMIRQSNGKQG